MFFLSASLSTGKKGKQGKWREGIKININTLQLQQQLLGRV